jgi:DNA primase
MDYTNELIQRGIEFHEVDEGQVMINCPFHDDSNPSMTVNINSGAFHCFSCKESGTTFVKLLAKLENISLEEAKEQLEEGQGDDTVMNFIQDKVNETLSDEEDEVVRYYSSKSFHKKFPRFTDSVEASSYLAHRGISRRTAHEFDLRWGNDGVMVNRIVYPIYTNEGELLSYGGRTILRDVKPKTRKVRSGLSSLYGLREVLTRTLSTKWSFKLPYLVVVEGEFDAMYLYELGYNVVSTMGTSALTDYQISLLKTYTKLVIFSYDGDKAGRDAQEKAIKRLKVFMPTVGVALPEGTDPNDLTEDEAEKIYGGLI